MLYNRRFAARIVFLAAIFAWFWRYYNGVLLCQIGVPVLQHPHLDYTYWAWAYSTLPHFLLENKLGIFVDIGWLTGAIGCVLYVRNNVFPMLFWASSVVYLLTLNLYDGWINAFFTGFLLLPIPFFTKKDRLFNLLMEGLRYYVVFIYLSSFLWKCAGGFFLNEHEGQAVIANAIDYWLYEQPASVFSTIYRYFIANKLLSYALILAGALSQAVFVLGFFTKKYDKILFILPFFFHLIAYYFVDVCFFEFLTLQIVFLWTKKTT
jgi:hypothetical protein